MFLRHTARNNNIARTNLIKGGGLISKILTQRPKILDDLLKTEGDQKITKIKICRTPILNAYSKTLNILTLGSLKKKMEKKGFDELYHLYIILYLENGNVYSIEKNQRVNIVNYDKANKSSKCMLMVFNKSSRSNDNFLQGNFITLREFMEAPEKIPIENLYRYEAFSDNCQKFVKDILNANGINKFNKFILQDIEDLAPSYLKWITKKITDTVALANYAIKGGEIK